MASRSHHHDHGCSRRQKCHENIPLVAGISATLSRCCSNRDSCSPCCNQSNHPSPPPPPPPLDDFLCLIASYIQKQQQETQCDGQTCSCEAKCKSFNGVRRQHQLNNVPREHDHIVLSCLLRKINDLESSLNKISACYDKRRDRHCTLRDSAARVIQTHFRSYLVHRSISLRYLKELATIKSNFLSLKSSVSGKSLFPYKAVSRQARDLLLELDSIQGRIDPMIRNSKRTLSRDLVSFLQYIDDCAMKRDEYIGKSAINVGFMGSASKFRCSGSKNPYVAEDRTMEKLSNRMRKIFVSSGGDEDNNAELEEFNLMNDDGIPIISIDKRKIGSSKSRPGALVKGNVVKPPVRKAMIFDKNRNVRPVYGNTREPTSSTEEDSVDDSEETIVIPRDDEVFHGSKTRNKVLVKGSGGKTRMVKTVSFDENGNVYKVYGDTPESSISEEDDSTNGSNNGNGNGDEKVNGNEVEEIRYAPKENKGFEEEEEEEETHSENEASSSEDSEGDATFTRNGNLPGRNEDKRESQVQKGSLMFSPPLPLKMEP